MATQTVNKNARVIAIVVMFFVYAMISFVTNLAAPIGTIWGNLFAGDKVLGMMGNMMNFLAYLFMGIPAGNLLVKIGYKKTCLWALVVGIVGLFVQYLSGVVGADTIIAHFGQVPLPLNYFIYLLGAFICGFCVCMLNTAVCPMLNMLGGSGKGGNQLLQFGGALNSLAGTLTPFFVGALIGVLTPSTKIVAVSPLLFIGMAIFAVAFVVLSFVYIPEPPISKGKKAYTHSPWSFRHTVLGVISIFFYVGVEVGIPGTLNFYLADQGANGAGVIGDASTIAGAIVAVYWLLMLVGRFLSGFISGAVSSKTQLTVVASLGVILVLAAIFTPQDVTVAVPSFLYDGGDVAARVPLSAYFLVLCGLSTSIMWGSIFNLAVEGLGKYTAQASGIFMMMVVGGGIMPLIQSAIANNAGYITSYWLVVAMLLFILFYGLIGSKNVNTDIPVDEEETLDPRNL